jgi:RNA polymerase sigma-70 factor (ECF subfamily)
VFQLSRYEEMSYQEIANQMGISIKTVENQMGKALKILRQELHGYLHILLLIWLFGT